MFTVVIGHGRGKKGRGQQTNRQCENRPTSEPIGAERDHREAHGSRAILKHITSTGRGGKGDHMMKRGAESSGEVTILFERNQRSKFPTSLDNTVAGTPALDTLSPP